MALYWVIKEVAGERRFSLQEAGSDLAAAQQAAASGFGGVLAEVIPVDARTAQRVAKQNIGRTMSEDEALEIISGK